MGLILHHPSLPVSKTLDYLIFDYSEDEDGNGTWDAMSSAQGEAIARMRTEIEDVLRWASRDFHGRQGAVDDGGDWDFDLQAQSDDGAALPAQFHPAEGRLSLHRPASGRVTVSLSLTGNSAFAEAFSTQFHWDAD